jgi:hypothetical protein
VGPGLGAGAASRACAAARMQGAASRAQDAGGVGLEARASVIAERE